MGAGRVLGANLRARRDEQGISLSELARRSGIAKGTLSQLESGGGNPTIETVFSLSNALGVPVSALLSDAPTADLILVRRRRSTYCPVRRSICRWYGGWNRPAGCSRSTRRSCGRRPCSTPTGILGSNT